MVRIVVSTVLIIQIIHRMIEIGILFHNVSIPYSTFVETDERGNEFRY